MTARRSLHARAALVVTVAAAVVVGTTTFATAHHNSDKSVLHACVVQADGQLRLLQDATSSCRANETPVQWSTGSDNRQLDQFKAALKAADADGGANDGDGLVDWTNLDAVPESVTTAGTRIDSLADAGQGQLLHWSNLFDIPEVLTDRYISFSELHGQATFAQLALGSVLGGAGGTVKDGSITADDLAGEYCQNDGDLYLEECNAGGVTGEKLMDGTVESRDLALRSVRYGADASSLLPDESSDDYPLGTGYAVATDGPRRILVAAQAQLSCVCGEVQVANTLVSYQLVRTSETASPTPTYIAASPVYTVEMNPYVRHFPVSLSVLDTADAGDHVYRLRVAQSGDRPVTVQLADISAQVLGAP